MRGTNILIKTLVMAACSLVYAGSVLGQDAYKISEQVFDFGHVGIDYIIFHNYKLINTGQKDIIIDSVDVLCDCSSVVYDKTALKPRDSVLFKLTFDTKDFYGPVSRKLNFFISIPEKKLLSFFYLAEVGQWQNGLMPDPFAVFLLPTHKQQSVKIPNKMFESIGVEIQEIHPDFFTVQLVKDKAKKEEQLELAVIPNKNLTKGTYLSNFTIKITAEGDENPTYLTIPVKIARF